MPARFCPQCQQEVSSAARYCPNCATPLPTTNPTIPRDSQPPPQTTPLEKAAGTSRLALLIFACLAVVVMAIGFVVLALRPSNPIVAATPPPVVSSPPVITAPQTPVVESPPITNAPTQPAVATPPITNAPSVVPGVLPPDVAAYVKFLQGIEDRRVALNNDTSSAEALKESLQQSQSSGQIDPEQHNEAVSGNKAKASQLFADYTNKWQILTRDFNATPAPQACSALANDYGKFIADYAATISKLQVALLNGDISQVMALQGAQKEITATGIQADQDLGDLCTRYSAPRPFTIQPEGASPSVIAQ